ncbi:unnamed protein product [Peniophora sp. CBMAI 1063]|nr:unnamed protein product [Peniophora sp. CBMAI 1063]
MVLIAFKHLSVLLIAVCAVYPSQGAVALTRRADAGHIRTVRKPLDAAATHRDHVIRSIIQRSLLDQDPSEYSHVADLLKSPSKLDVDDWEKAASAELKDIIVTSDLAIKSSRRNIERTGNLLRKMLHVP